MIQLDDISKDIKGLMRDIKKYEKMRDALGKMTFENTSQKRRGNANANLNWLAMNIDQSKYHLHCELVKIGLSEPKHIDYYTDKEYSPSGFHTYLHARSKEDITN